MKFKNATVMTGRLRFVLECIHVLFTLPLVLPAICIFSGERDQRFILILYFLGYLLLPGLILLKKVLKKNISLGFCILIILAVAAAEAVLGFAGASFFLSGSYRVITAVTLFVGAVLEGIDVLLVRRTETDRQEAFRLGDVDFIEQIHVLQRPSLTAMAFLFVFYIIGLIARISVLCNIVLITSILYLIAARAYDFIDNTENYLNIHYSMAALPVRRILRMGAILFTAVIAVILLSAVPAALTERARIYPDFKMEVPVGEAAETLGIAAPSDSAGFAGSIEIGNPLEGLIPEDDFEWPAWVNDIIYVLAAVILVFVIIAAVRSIKEIFKRFLRVYDDNGDIIEFLDPEESASSVYKSTKFNRRTEEGGIRYRYKRMIKKNLKGRPMHYETPYEMEERAGIASRPEVVLLHNEYENVRYGKQH